MSIPNLTNSNYVIQPQNCVYQAPLSHAVVTNAGVGQSAGIMAAIPGTDMSNSPQAGTSVLKSAHFGTATQEELITRSRLNDLVRDVDSSLTIETEVEDVLLAYADDLLDRIINGASMIAQHRSVDTIEVKDVQQFLNRNYGMWVPGFGTDELRLYRRNLAVDAHKQRLALIRKSLRKY